MSKYHNNRELMIVSFLMQKSGGKDLNSTALQFVPYLSKLTIRYFNFSFYRHLYD